MTERITDVELDAAWRAANDTYLSFKAKFANDCFALYADIQRSTSPDCAAFLAGLVE